MTDIRIFYFGCGNTDKGHHWRQDGGGLIPYAVRTAIPFWDRIDGVHPPREKGTPLYVATRVSCLGWTILAWWDRSVDTRPGSNAAIAAKGDWGAVRMMREFAAQYPKTSARFPVLTVEEEAP